jgi:Putative transposase
MLGKPSTRVAGSAQGRTAGGTLFPRRVHAAAQDRCHRISEQGRDLRSLIQGERGDAADDRGRPQAPRRQDRLHVGSAYLGQRDDASPARAHDRSGRWYLARWIEVDQRLGGLPAPVLKRLFRGKMLAMLKAAHADGRLQFFGDHAGLADCTAFKSYLEPLYDIKWHVYAKRPFGSSS